MKGKKKEQNINRDCVQSVIITVHYHFDQHKSDQITGGYFCECW